MLPDVPALLLLFHPLLVGLAEAQHETAFVEDHVSPADPGDTVDIGVTVKLRIGAGAEI